MLKIQFGKFYVTLFAKNLIGSHGIATHSFVEMKPVAAVALKASSRSISTPSVLIINMSDTVSSKS